MNKKAVVTGGTKGIGLAVCRLFANKGFDIATCCRHEDDLQKLKSELEQNGVSVLTRTADLGIKNEAQDFAEFVKRKWQHIDLLVNNTGIFIPGEILKEKDGIMEKLWSVNLASAYHVTRILAPLMIERKRGHIFNMCSVASIKAYPNGGSYSISKFGLLGFSKVLREELKNENIKVTAIIAGSTWTDSWKGADYPVDRLMQSEDIAKTIYSAYTLGDSSVIEELIIRPQKGDL
jgi:short-subunit dehydrogenase